MSRRNCPACGSAFLRGRRVLLVTHTSSATVNVCRGCAKLAKPAALVLCLHLLEDSDAREANEASELAGALAHRRADYAANIPPGGTP